MSQTAACYKRHRFPATIIAHAVWLYLRFSLSLRAVEERLLERGVEVSYGTLRRWVAQFGPVIARGLRRRQGCPSRVWHLDEVQVSVRGRRLWLWRAVDEHGVVLEELLQPRRDAKAAKRLLRRLMKRAGRLPRRIVTDKLGPHAAAKRDVAPGLERLAPIRGSTTGPRTATCRSDRVSGRCGAIARPAGCSASSRCTRPSATASSRPLTVAARPRPSATIASRPSASGAKRPASPAKPYNARHPPPCLG